MNRSSKQSSSVRRRKKLTGKSDWFKKTSEPAENEEKEKLLPEGWMNEGPTPELEKNENGCGPAPGNPMLATPNSSSNCGGEDPCIRNLSVDAEKCKNGGESAPGNPMLTPPNPVMDQKDSLKRKRSRCPEKRRKRVINYSESQYYFKNEYYPTWKSTPLSK